YLFSRKEIITRKTITVNGVSHSSHSFSHKLWYGGGRYRGEIGPINSQSFSLGRVLMEILIEWDARRDGFCEGFDPFAFLIFVSVYICVLVGNRRNNKTLKTRVKPTTTTTTTTTTTRRLVRGIGARELRRNFDDNANKEVPSDRSADDVVRESAKSLSRGNTKRAVQLSAPTVEYFESRECQFANEIALAKNLAHEGASQASNKFWRSFKVQLISAINAKHAFVSFLRSFSSSCSLRLRNGLPYELAVLIQTVTPTVSTIPFTLYKTTF
ncbi:hypothetical protein V1478_011416, partial [Vespula squamosa]